jgi:hypothetical protein
MIETQEWIVKWENGKSRRFIPGDSFGMTRFIINGLEEGKVYINDDEVVSSVLKDGMLYYRLKSQLENE